MDTLLGKTLSHYRIVEKIGAGGMGEVYRAHDTRLGRDVAIKALPEIFSSDPERRLRFEREAKALASLNHPNIAGIHGIEEIDGRRYLALELVEGETLAARIARGPLAQEEAVAICIQIAAGIEAAHEAGVIHRDLKPGNVMITAADRVKVVDFGLAKTRTKEPSETSPNSPTKTDSPTLSESPAIGAPATLPGVVLGTAAYLSPEQARGKVVDRRTDIWSFGCVLYECLSGRRAFEGETLSDVIARILRADVEWELLPARTSPRLADLLRRCFEKDSQRRLRDIGDARLALEEIQTGVGATGEPVPRARLLSRRVLVFAAAVAMVCTAIGVGVWSTFWPGRHVAPDPATVKHLSITLPRELRGPFPPFITPDGRSLIAEGTPLASPSDPRPRPRFYHRSIGGDRFEALKGTEGGVGIDLSPDGQWLYFIVRQSEHAAEFRLMKTRVDGSTPPIPVMNWDSKWRIPGIALNGGDLLVSSQEQDAFIRLTPVGGAPRSHRIAIAAAGFEGTLTPYSVLPGDRMVLANSAGRDERGFLYGTAVVDLESGKAKILLRDGGNGYYSPTGHLVFTRRSTLMAVPFDLDRLEVRGEPAVVLEGLRIEQSYGHAFFWLSRDGTLIYLPGGVIGEHRRLIVVDRAGRVSDWSPNRARLEWSVDVSPSGTLAAVQATNARGVTEIWTWGRGRSSARRISIPGFDATGPAWSSDGRRIAFIGPENAVYVQSLEGGSPRKISALKPPAFYTRLSWSPDGSTLLATNVVSYFLQVDVDRISVPPVGGSLSVAAPFLAAPDWRELRASFSPNGRWVAYESNETGQHEVYVAAYRPDGTPGAPLKVSTGGGSDPRWGRDGTEIFYRPEVELGGTGPAGRVMRVPLRFQPALSAGEPTPLWDLDQLRVIQDGGPCYDLLPGGELVAIQKGEEEVDATHADVVVGFFEELKRKMQKEAGH